MHVYGIYLQNPYILCNLEITPMWMLKASATKIHYCQVLNPIFRPKTSMQVMHTDPTTHVLGNTRIKRIIACHKSTHCLFLLFFLLHATIDLMDWPPRIPTQVGTYQPPNPLTKIEDNKLQLDPTTQIRSHDYK